MPIKLTVYCAALRGGCCVTCVPPCVADVRPITVIIARCLQLNKRRLLLLLLLLPLYTPESWCESLKAYNAITGRVYFQNFTVS